jgi:putative DNA primase/helicase
VPGQEDLFASVVTWGEGIAGSARDMLAVAEANDQDGATSASAEARSFLSEVLSVGPISAKEVFRQAAEAGIARRTLTRAKADAGVETKRSGRLSLLYWGGLLSSAFRLLHRFSGDVGRRVRASLRDRH